MSRTLGEAMLEAAKRGWDTRVSMTGAWVGTGFNVGAHFQRNNKSRVALLSIAMPDEPTLIAWLDALGKEGR